jgi:hypothetical protein
VSDSGDLTEEVLVSPDAALPAEVNTLQQGTLVSRVEFAYDRHPDLGFVRRFMRAEQVGDPSSGTRLMTDIELANLAVNPGGAR